MCIRDSFLPTENLANTEKSQLSYWHSYCNNMSIPGCGHDMVLPMWYRGDCLDEIMEDLKRFPVIPAIRDVSRIDAAVSKKSRCIFLLTGNILNIKNIVRRVKSANRRIFLHLDLSLIHI